MVTSSAVVGSSAISSFGLQAIAMAIITRWHWPPDIWCGKALSRLLGIGDADEGEELDRARAPAPCASMAMWTLQHFLDLEADGEAGVEARHRLLEDHGDVLADDLAPVGRRRSSEGRCR